MAINFSQVLKSKTKKVEDSTHSALKALDRPQKFEGYAHILKGTGSPMVDRASAALRANGGLRTRMLGTKLW
jgi:hypothetical protein